MQFVLVVIAWCLLLVFAWPLALLVLLLMPILWLLSLPFRLVGVVFDGALALVKALFHLPARLLGYRGS
jgi:hypothetical protein